jgi:hypothetical protein
MRGPISRPEISGVMNRQSQVMTSALDERIADLQRATPGTVAAMIAEVLDGALDYLKDARQGSPSGIRRADEQLGLAVQVLNTLRERLRLMDEAVTREGLRLVHEG